MKNQAFTLIEMILVIVLVSIVVATGARLSGMNKNAELFQETIDRLEMLQRLIVGDERILQSGRRADFGYYGLRGVFPTSLLELQEMYHGLAGNNPADPYIFANDAWGAPYVENSPAGSGGIITIESDAAATLRANAAGDAGSTDITLQFRIADYTSNRVVIFFKDVNGTLLLVSENADPLTNNYHIRQVGLYNRTQSFTLSAGDFTVIDEGYIQIDNVRAGPVLITVFPADSAEFNTNNDWRPFTSSADLGVIEYRDSVYPTGGFSGNNNYENVIEIRFPGSVSNDAAGPAAIPAI